MSPDDLAKILAAITTKSNETDPYQIHSSEAPGFRLVSVPLKGPNYIYWSRAVQIALRAKKKLGFVNGTIKAPEPDSDDYEKWATADSMVVSWLLNAMSKDISDAFVFSKRDESVTEYYTKLKKKWDDLLCLAPLPVCCETGTAISDYDNNRRLMQFLMGLGDEYDNVKNQVLLQSPLPSINKAYSMVMSIEKQREVQTSNATSTETAVIMMARKDNNNYSDNTSSSRNNNRYSSYPRKEDKKKEYCTKCKIGGHTIEDCFQINGYPGWFIEMQKKRGVDVRKYYSANNVAQVAISDSPLQQHVLSQKSSVVQDNAVTDYIQREFQKFLRAKGGFPDPAAEDVHNVNFTGILLNSVITSIDFNCKDNWIIDSGATDHITPKLSFFDQVVQLNPPKTICLLDKTTRKVTHIGNIKLNDRIILYNVLAQQPQLNTSADILTEIVECPTTDLSHVQPFVIRRGTRQRKPLSWLDDFVTDSQTHSNIYFSSSHLSFVAQISKVIAMNNELTALEQNNTWVLTDLPSNVTPTGYGSIERYKARLVAKGYNQLLVLLTIATASAWPIPPGYEKGKPGQAGRQRNKELTASLLTKGFHQSSFDHCLFTRGQVDLIAELKTYLHDKFTIKDLGHAKCFLDIVADTGLKLSSDMGKPLPDPECYRRLIGRFYAVQQLSQFMQTPHQQHFKAALAVGLFLPASNDLKLRAFSDADWASCTDSRRSITGRSSAESEYRAMASTVYFHSLVPTPIPLHCDNTTTIHIAANPVFHERTKHIDIDCHVTFVCKLGLVDFSPTPA
ncbi:hypothetical protein MANES_18G122701v8 [Manihot esculenta]|uniref:Uncharacterized protein n=1 Tax=Manihot esculenta TaxID=3983 RepID=A0ACB7G084_MANES|nr:hypothetical protein MANES_18G122701v8 [Manihot esculenta]